MSAPRTFSDHRTRSAERSSLAGSGVDPQRVAADPCRSPTPVIIDNDDGSSAPIGYHERERSARSPVATDSALTSSHEIADAPAQESAQVTAALIGKLWIERRDVKAAQGNDGAYRPVEDRNHTRLPFTKSDLRAHLDGTATYGHYLVSPADNCRVFAFDIDLCSTGVWLEDWDNDIWVEGNPRDAWLTPDHPAKPWLTLQLRTLADALAGRIHSYAGLPSAIAYSGNKGLHVYGFTGSEPAKVVRGVAQDVIESFGSFENSRGVNFFKHTAGPDHSGYPCLEIEVFPKQDDLDGKDLGNLMRLPLGVNRKSGQAGFFVDPNQPYETLVPLDPSVALSL